MGRRCKHVPRGLILSGQTSVRQPDRGGPDVVVKTWDGQKLCGECALKEGYIMRLETGMMLRVDLRSTIFHRNEHGKVPA